MEYSQNTELPVRRVFREDIRNKIRNAIFSGELKPGDKIIEIAWARQLGVSQGPVREAIRDLEAQGLIETIPFKGSHVRNLSQKEFKDNYSVRICLESKSIRDAIEHLDDQQLSDLSVELMRYLDAMDQHARNGELQEFSNIDKEFHKAIILATGNEVLLRLWEQCNLRNWFLFSSLTDASSLIQLQQSHVQIFTALSKRDVAEATAMLEYHLTDMMNGFMFGRE